MPLHPQTAGLVEAMAAANEGAPTIQELSPAEVRDGYRELAAMFGEPSKVGGRVYDRAVPGLAGDIPVRVYTPAGVGPHPVLVFYHGGGWVIGDLETHDRECRILCRDADALVVSVDYRLAPEHPYPASHDDAWAALRWIANNAPELDGDPGRIAVGGDSAGGNLSATMALLARDAGIDLKLQMLIYPATDLRGHNPAWEGERFASLSDNAEGPFLTRGHMTFFFEHLSTGLDGAAMAADWRLSPILARNHADVAPAFVATCEFDPLRDEGNAYAEQLKAAGVVVEHKEWAGQPHVLFQLSPVLDDGKKLLAECAAALKDAFA